MKGALRIQVAVAGRPAGVGPVMVELADVVELAPPRRPAAAGPGARGEHRAHEHLAGGRRPVRVGGLRRMSQRRVVERAHQRPGPGRDLADQVSVDRPVALQVPRLVASFERRSVRHHMHHDRGEPFGDLLLRDAGRTLLATAGTAEDLSAQPCQRGIAAPPARCPRIVLAYALGHGRDRLVSEDHLFCRADDAEGGHIALCRPDLHIARCLRPLAFPADGVGIHRAHDGPHDADGPARRDRSGPGEFCRRIRIDAREHLRVGHRRRLDHQPAERRHRDHPVPQQPAAPRDPVPGRLRAIDQRLRCTPPDRQHHRQSGGDLSVRLEDPQRLPGELRIRVPTDHHVQQTADHHQPPPHQKPLTPRRRRHLRQTCIDQLRVRDIRRSKAGAAAGSGRTAFHDGAGLSGIRVSGIRPGGLEVFIDPAHTDGPQIQCRPRHRSTEPTDRFITHHDSPESLMCSTSLSILRAIEVESTLLSN